MMTGAVATHGHITRSSKKLKSLSSPQRRSGVGEPGSSSAGPWSKGWRVVGGWTTPSDDGRVGGLVNDGWPRVDDASGRRVGGRGQISGRGWTIVAGGMWATAGE
jgi:hypothetical protein